MFQKSVTHVKFDFSIDGMLIAIGNTTWQTKNLTSVSIEKGRLAVDLPAPSFTQKAPSRRFHWGLLAILVASSWIFALSFDHPSRVGFPGTILACALIWFIGHFSHKNQLRIWESGKQKSEEKKKAWRNLLEHPIDYYSLVLDSSSGKSVALSTFDQSAISEMHSVILLAMRNTTTAPLTGKISAIQQPIEAVEGQYNRYCASVIAAD